jgi:glutathione S-transferase
MCGATRQQGEQSMATPIIFGPEMSTYVRTVRLAFEEKPAQYEMVDVSLMKNEQKEPAHLARHPFGKVPAFEHDGLALYETSAIVRYVDQAFPGATLTPGDARERTRMNQVISIIDYYGYTAIISNCVLQRFFGNPDEKVIAEARPRIELCLKEFERIKGSDKFLAGSQVSLADFYLLPLVFYLQMMPEKSLLEQRKGLLVWWEGMSQRSSVKKTQPNLG